MAKFKKAKFKTSIKVRERKKSFNIPLIIRKPAAFNVQQKASSHDHTDSQSLEFEQPSTSTGLTLNEKRNIQLFENWSSIRKQLQAAFVESSFLPNKSLCVACKDVAKVRCQSCGPRHHLCMKCAYFSHLEINQFHLLETWKDGMFVPLYADHGVVGYGHECSTQVKRQFTLIDSHGVKHIKSLAVCDCEPDAVTLIKCNFWPGTPNKPAVGFHMQIMILMEKLFLQSQVSVHDFAEVLEEIQPKLGLKIFTSMYSVLSSGSFEEFRLFKYNLNYMDCYCDNLSNGTLCPLCPEDDGVLIESMDACMGLVRKKCKGSAGLLEPRNGNLFFSDQVDVDNFVNNYGKNDILKNNEECSRFHAGEVLSSLRSKGRNKVFDEKGVFGRVCRHDFPKSFINLKHGERISYSIYEMKKLKESLLNKPSNIKVILMYDIACLLSSHLKNTNQEYMLENTSLAIPIFHCYGHKASCQVSLNPRRIEGIGLTDGEGVERLWAYLRGYSAMTKEMGAEKRIDALTHGLIFYGQRLRKRFGPSLGTKLKKAQDLASAVAKEMKEITSTVPIPFDKDMIIKWKSSELDAIKPKENVLELNWDETYVNILLGVKQIKGQLAFAVDTDDKKVKETQTKLKRKEKALTLTEKKHKIQNRWKEEDRDFQSAQKRLLSKQRSALVLQLHRLASERIFLLEMKKKYADGQGVAIKLSSQITKVTDAVQKCLGAINAACDEALHFDDVKDPSGAFYCGETPPSNTTDNIPLSLKKKVISLFCLYERCNEEIDLVKVEMMRILTHNFKEVQVIDEYVDALGSSPHEKGLKASLFQKKLSIQLEQFKLGKAFEGLSVSPYVFEEINSYCCISGSITSPLITNENEMDGETHDEEQEEEEEEEDNYFWDSSDSDSDNM